MTGGSIESLVPGSADAVEEALAGGVLVADGPVIGFRHELIREAIEDSISPPRRAELHARVMSALAEQVGESDNAWLAHPDRKTDVTDAEWLCRLLEAGLLRASADRAAV